MATLGLDVLDRTVQEASTWLNGVADELGTESRQDAYHALRAVLFTTRDRIPADLAADFAAQLPALVRGIFYEGYRPAEQPKKHRTLEEWNAEVEGYLSSEPDPPEAEAATRAVFATVNKHVTQGSVKKTFQALPEDVRALWPGVSESVAHE